MVVWFFGGSTLWGEGQRDLHTIPSEVARLAQAEGDTLRVVNYGIRGYTAFQEPLVFEQELARRAPPDLAVFYHGVNGSYSLLESRANLGSQPSIFQLETVSDAFVRAPTLPAQRRPPEPSVGASYLETSLVNKVLRTVHGAFEAPAGAQDSPFVATPGQTERAFTEAAQIYRRSVALIRHESARSGVRPLVFWQPAGELPPGLPQELTAVLDERVRDLHIDISDAVDDTPGPVYIDAVHTNELGARRSAEAIWRHLEPAVDAVADR